MIRISHKNYQNILYFSIVNLYGPDLFLSENVAKISTKNTLVAHDKSNIEISSVKRVDDNPIFRPTFNSNSQHLGQKFLQLGRNHYL